MTPPNPSNFSRRAFVGGATAAAASLALSRLLAAEDKPPAPKHVLLRSSWQTVNIGDIAHTPGMLALIEKHFPETLVTLWPNALSDSVRKMLAARFPKLAFAETPETQAAAMKDCDVCLHGSGPGLVGRKELNAWRTETGKPYGFGGVTLNDAELKDEAELLSKADFVFCRDTTSLAALQATGIDAPLEAFGPDATFFADLRDDDRAAAFLAAHDLKQQEFACFVPRLRWTPYWKEGRKYPAGQIEERTADNEKHAETDHAKMRVAIAAWVRETGKKALLCPEMTYEVELLRPLLFDGLPDDVKPHVVVRPGYWLTDEATSTYARAAAVVSLEMHSPILAIAAGTPAIHLRQPTDTRKGQMWRDVGLEEWLFEIDQTEGDAIAERLLKMHSDSGLTSALVQASQAYVADRGAAMMTALGGAVARK